jgi:hypothetical protein
MRVIFVQVQPLHQEALGPLDDLTILHLGLDAGEPVAQCLMGTELANRHVDDLPHSLRRQFLCDIGGHAGLDGGLDLVGSTAFGEQDHRARFMPVQGAHAVQRVARRVIDAADDDIGTAQPHLLGQADDVGGQGDNLKPVLLQPAADGFGPDTIRIDQQNTQGLAPSSAAAGKDANMRPSACIGPACAGCDRVGACNADRPGAAIDP